MSNYTTENLITYTGTIQPGQRLIKRKDGTFLPIGVAGAGTDSSMDFYKCANVDLSTHTWTGYKAIFDSSTGQWSYDSSLTSDGLTYYNTPPAVNSIYSHDTLIEVNSFSNIPTGTYWDQISANIQAGLYTTDNLGDKFVIPNEELYVTSYYTIPKGTIELSIVAIDNANLVNKSYQHSITLMATHVLWTTEYGWNQQSAWKNQRNRSFLQTDFFNSLDEDFRTHIAQVNRTLWTGGSSGDSEDVIDTIFLPSYTEVGFGNNNGVAEGIQFNSMTSNSSRIRKNLDETNGTYTLSSLADAYGDLYVISSNGTTGSSAYMNQAYFCPCFVIA